jgi:hypothetical protein
MLSYLNIDEEPLFFNQEKELNEMRTEITELRTNVASLTSTVQSLEQSIKIMVAAFSKSGEIFTQIKKYKLK